MAAISLTNAIVPVRDEHRFDEAALGRYMTANVEGCRGPFEIGQCMGGMSNPTFVVSDAGGKRYVLRKKPPGDLLPSAHAVDREFRVIRALAATASRPALLHVLGPEERDPDLLGTVELVDAETGQRRFLDVTPSIQEAYRAHVVQWLDDVQRLCGRFGVQYLPAYSDGSLSELMTQTLRRAAVVE